MEYRNLECEPFERLCDRAICIALEERFRGKAKHRNRVRPARLTASSQYRIGGSVVNRRRPQHLIILSSSPSRPISVYSNLDRSARRSASFWRTATAPLAKWSSQRFWRISTSGWSVRQIAYAPGRYGTDFHESDAWLIRPIVGGPVFAVIASSTRSSSSSLISGFLDPYLAAKDVRGRVKPRRSGYRC